MPKFQIPNILKSPFHKEQPDVITEGQDEEAVLPVLKEVTTRIDYKEGMLGGLQRLWDYMRLFRWINDLTRWLLQVGGNVSESAFILATTFVIIELVAPSLVNGVLGFLVTKDNVSSALTNLNQMAAIAFAALPELILIQSAIFVWDLWAVGIRKGYAPAIVWAVVFSIPTLAFATMTLIIISRFVNSESLGTAVKLTGLDLQLRVIFGWGYGVLRMLYSSQGKGMISSQIALMEKQLRSEQSTSAELQVTIGTLNTTIEKWKADSEQKDVAITNLENANASLRITNEQLRVTSSKSKVINPVSDVTSAKRKVTNVGNNTHTHGNGLFSVVGAENTHTHINTHTNTSEKYEAFKKVARAAIRAGEATNMRKWSKDANVSYNTGRGYWDRVRPELEAEFGELPMVAEGW